jgi:hypothetical protein
MDVFEAEDKFILYIGSDVAASPPLVQESYTVGLARLPCAFLGRAQFGVFRRPGVLWVRRQVYADVADEINDLMLNDCTYPGELRRRFEHVRDQLRSVLVGAAPDDVSRLNQVWARLCDALAFVPFNWLIPFTHFEDEVRSLGNHSPDEAKRWISAVSAPTHSPHFIVFHRRLCQLAIAAKVGADPDYTGFAREMGKLQTGFIAPAPFENPEIVRTHVIELATSSTVEDLEHEITRLDAVHTRAAVARDEALADAARRAPHPAALERMRAAADLLRLAADEEEERKVLQMHALTYISGVAEHLGKDLTYARAADLGVALGIEAAPRRERQTAGHERGYAPLVDPV